MTTDQVQPVARASERGAATRSALLTAAREVFTTEGYAQAGVTDIVNKAGASVGSLYHHFSGKADLYLTLFEELNHEQAGRTRHAMRGARDAGITDPKQLFLVGARSFSPSPITTTPFIDTVLISSRIAWTAAPSAPFLSPRPTHRAAAIAPASVTLASSSARFRSGACRAGGSGACSWPGASAWPGTAPSPGAAPPGASCSPGRTDVAGMAVA